MSQKKYHGGRETSKPVLERPVRLTWSLQLVAEENLKEATDTSGAAAAAATTPTPTTTSARTTTAATTKWDKSEIHSE